MLRRLPTAVVPRRVASCAARLYTPSAALQKLYASDFDKAEFPVSIIPSDAALFAKFLYKAAESGNAFDAVLDDLRTIAAAVPTLPIFWERTSDVGKLPQFSGLSEPTTFTLHWMQSNGMLDLLPDVAEVYETYVNAKLKRAVAKIYVAPGMEGDAETLKQAKQVAATLLKENEALAGHKLDYKVIVDRTITEGFAVDLNGTYVNEAKGRETAARMSDESNYLHVPAPQLPRTKWEDSIETEVLRKYLDAQADYDAEELMYGV